MVDEPGWGPHKRPIAYVPLTLVLPSIQVKEVVLPIIRMALVSAAFGFLVRDYLASIRVYELSGLQINLAAQTLAVISRVLKAGILLIDLPHPRFVVLNISSGTVLPC